ADQKLAVGYDHEHTVGDHLPGGRVEDRRAPFVDDNGLAALVGALPGARRHLAVDASLLIDLGAELLDLLEIVDWQAELVEARGHGDQLVLVDLVPAASIEPTALRVEPDLARVDALDADPASGAVLLPRHRGARRHDRAELHLLLEHGAEAGVVAVGRPRTARKEHLHDTRDVGDQRLDHAGAAFLLDSEELALRVECFAHRRRPAVDVLRHFGEHVLRLPRSLLAEVVKPPIPFPVALPRLRSRRVPAIASLLGLDAIGVEHLDDDLRVGPLDLRLDRWCIGVMLGQVCHERLPSRRRRADDEVDRLVDVGRDDSQPSRTLEQRLDAARDRRERNVAAAPAIAPYHRGDALPARMGRYPIRLVVRHLHGRRDRRAGAYDLHRDVLVLADLDGLARGVLAERFGVVQATGIGLHGNCLKSCAAALAARWFWPPAGG